LGRLESIRVPLPAAMITMFNAMPPFTLHRPTCRSSIIAALLLLAATVLAGCSMMKLGYSQGSGFAFHWVDRYVELDDAQSLRVRTALDEWFAWHRRTQLPDYADLLARAQSELAADASSERMCAWSREVRARIDTAVERAIPVAAEVALTLAPAQIAAIEKRQAKTNEEFRDEHLHRDPAKRRRALLRREIERAESFYGKLDRRSASSSPAPSPARPTTRRSSSPNGGSGSRSSSRCCAASPPHVPPGPGRGGDPYLGAGLPALAARALPGLCGTRGGAQLRLCERPAQRHVAGAATRRGEEAQELRERRPDPGRRRLELRRRTRCSLNAAIAWAWRRC
jgi:hypothetical protein